MESAWFLWLHTSATLVITLPNDAPIVSVWIPNVPITTIAFAPTGGSTFYTIAATGGEVVPMPINTTTPLTSLTLSGMSGSTDLAVYATTQTFKPWKKLNA